MKTILLQITFLLLSPILSQAQSTFEHFFATPDHDFINDMAQTNDGGFFLVGYTWSVDNGSNDILVIKTDSLGVEQWSHTYGTINNEYGQDVFKTSDNYFILKSFLRDQEEKCYLNISKLTEDGNLVWSKNYSLTQIGFDPGACGNKFSCCETSDGGYLFSAFGNKFIKTDSDGKLHWVKSVLESYQTINFNGISLTSTHDGNIVFTGLTWDFGILLVKINPEGEVIWSNKISDSIYSGGHTIFENKSHELVIVGSRQSFYLSFQAIFILKFDESGIKINERLLKGSESKFPDNIIETSENEYLLSGYSYLNNGSFATNLDAFLLKLDKEFNPVWNKGINGFGDDISGGIIQTADGGYAWSGYTNSFGNHNSDIYFVKLDKYGFNRCLDDNETLSPAEFNTTMGDFSGLEDDTTYVYDANLIVHPIEPTDNPICNAASEEEEIEDEKAQFSPNPFNNETVLRFKSSESLNWTFKMFNSQGSLVKEIDNRNNSEIILHKANLLEGIYFYKILSDNKLLDWGKLIIQ